uniref:Uncharacterized protein n=1 Tax=Rhizophora mucronata TaxID=61149 RepID=A0A2P2NT02_RHIMU
MMLLHCPLVFDFSLVLGSINTPSLCLLLVSIFLSILYVICSFFVYGLVYLLSKGKKNMYLLCCLYAR